jgi:hypothetical protein
VEVEEFSDIMIDLLQGRVGKSVLVNHYITPGRATITANAFACVDFSVGPCDDDSDRQVLTLRR